MRVRTGRRGQTPFPGPPTATSSGARHTVGTEGNRHEQLGLTPQDAKSPITSAPAAIAAAWQASTQPGHAHAPRLRPRPPQSSVSPDWSAEGSGLTPGPVGSVLASGLAPVIGLDRRPCRPRPPSGDRALRSDGGGNGGNDVTVRPLRLSIWPRSAVFAGRPGRRPPSSPGAGLAAEEAVIVLKVMGVAVHAQSTGARRVTEPFADQPATFGRLLGGASTLPWRW